MNRNSLIGLVLIFAILMGYMYFTQPSQEELKEQRRQDSLQRVAALAQSLSDSLARAEKDSLQSVPDSLKSQSLSPGTLAENDVNGNVLNDNPAPKGPFAIPDGLDTAHFTVQNDLLKITFSSLGGRPSQVELLDYQTFDSLPLLLFTEKSSILSLSFYHGRQSVQTGGYLFVPVWYDNQFQGNDSMVLSADSLRFGMRWYPFDSIGDGSVDKRYVEFVYTVRKGSYKIGFDMVFSGMKDAVAPQTEQMSLYWSNDLRKQEKVTNSFNGATIYHCDMDGSVDYLSETKDATLEIPTRFKWLSFKQAFFTSVLIADEYFNSAEGSVFTDKANKDPHYLRSMESVIGIPYRSDEITTIPMSFYFGPNKFKTLKQYDLGLERQIPLGWSFFLMHWINRGAVIPVFNWLETTGMNYGIIILILTLLLKLVLFPIAYKTYMSSAKMRALKPEVDEIAARFPKKEDAMKKQQATMALYKSVGVNPMAGCVPMLLQFPILLAMFRFFPASIELRQQSFLWAHDLSSYDSILDLPFNIPFYGDHVSLFTLLMTVSTIIYTRVNNQMMSGGSQMPGMKTMMYIMPIMFLGIFNNYSSGLSYYYFLANIITFAQMGIIRRFVDEKKLRAKLQANKQKPVKKSRFQQRLEEAAKQQGMKQKRK